MTELDLTLAWARAFGLTLLVELAVAVPLIGSQVTSLPRRLCLCSFAQLVSHPIVWFVLPTLPLARGPYLITAELWAWLSEAALYAFVLPSLPGRRALGIALAANLASVTVGLGLRYLGADV